MEEIAKRKAIKSEFWNSCLFPTLNLNSFICIRTLGADGEQCRWEHIFFPAQMEKSGIWRDTDCVYTDVSFLKDMVMNANVVKPAKLTVMQDSVSISQYICIVALMVCIWAFTLGSTIDESSLLLLDVFLLGSGFLVLLSEKEMYLEFTCHHLLNISFFITGLYLLSPIYHTLTRSISSDSIWALTVTLVVSHLFLHDYSGSSMRSPGASNNPTSTSNISLNASIVVSVLIASRLPSEPHGFAIMLFSLQVFLFVPWITYSIKKYSFRLHLCSLFGLMSVTLWLVFTLHRLLFALLLGLLVFITVVCPILAYKDARI